jgi:hypothetical protein
MTDTGTDFWTDDTSVLFTSFWGWRPDEWATVGWSKARGRTYRDNLLKRLTDPFIAVVYVTRDPDGYDLDLVGKVAGFYLMSHEKGHRDDFTHPVHHGRYTEKWEHSLRALRAFAYISDPLPIAKQIEPALSTGAARSIAGWGKILEDTKQINTLRRTPWREVAMYRPGIPIETRDDVLSTDAMVPAGPITTQPYTVSPSVDLMFRRLYVLRLHGDTDAYLGKSAAGRHIYKIGLSASPDDRRRTLQKGMPRGAFIWKTERVSPVDGTYPAVAAVAGEDAMKRYLAGVGGRDRHLGGEFYLASNAEIHEAWISGIAQADQTSEDSKNA